MISDLFDAVLLVALLVTSVQVARMYHQLRRLRTHESEYRRFLRDTAAALDSVDAAVRDLNSHGSQIIMTLGDRIALAEALTVRLEDTIEAAREPLERYEAAVQRPFLAYSAPEPEPAPVERSRLRAEGPRPQVVAEQPALALRSYGAPEPVSLRSYAAPEPVAQRSYAAPEPVAQRPYLAPEAAAAAAAAARQERILERTLGDYLGKWRPARPADFRKAAGGPDRL